MSTAPLYPRYAEPLLLEALADFPEVLIYGPRQCGKTTLAQQVGTRLGYTYITFDDDVARAAAEADPVGFVADLTDHAILDEVQRERTPGRFLLTGSAHVLFVPKLVDSLAGRLEMIRLDPLAQCTLERRESGFLDTLGHGV